MDVLMLDKLPDYLQRAIKNGTSRTTCPRCEGGRSKEVSLSVRPSHMAGANFIKLSCWRASCGWYAMTMTDPNATLMTGIVKPASVYRDPIHEITPFNIGELLQGRYGLRLRKIASHGWGVADDQRTLVMPVHDPYGNVRGHVTRTFDTPKRCYTFKATAQPWLDWWCGAGGAPCVLVEDCLSACRLSQLGYHAVALLGTGISVPQAKEIEFVMQGGTVYLALDRDAFVKSLDLMRRHKHIIELLPVCLDEDVKNMAYDKDIYKIFGALE